MKMKCFEQQRRREWALVIGCVVFVSLGACSKSRNKEEAYKSYQSPDGRYEILVTIADADTSGFPGASGDRPGYVSLVDSSGKVLKREKVEMVNMVDPPVWSAGKVAVKFVADWYFP